jgi:hypothetical protein
MILILTLYLMFSSSTVQSKSWIEMTYPEREEVLSKMTFEQLEQRYQELQERRRKALENLDLPGLSEDEKIEIEALTVERNYRLAEKERIEQAKKEKQEQDRIKQEQDRIKQEQERIEQEQKEQQALREKLEKEILKILPQKTDKWIENRIKELVEKKYWYVPQEVGKTGPKITQEEEIELDLLYNERNTRGKKAEERRKQEYIKRRAERIKTFPLEIQKTIKEGKVQLGMTKEQVIFSWGKPERINRSVGSWGVHEQWVYGSSYLYFQNDILTSWQDSR